MKKFGYTLLLVSVFFLIGTVGAVDKSGMPMAEGIVKIIVCIALAFTGTRIIEKCEEN